MSEPEQKECRRSIAILLGHYEHWQDLRRNASHPEERSAYEGLAQECQRLLAIQRDLLNGRVPNLDRADVLAEKRRAR